MTGDGRFAPSPTGTLHLGNLRTALLAWLYARSQGARFLVRIEDLDAGRVREPFVAEQLGDLRALGLGWDAPPVRQSARTAAYDDALDRLARDGLLYPCFCTRAEIRAAASAPHGPHAEGAYPGTCRDLAGAQRAAHERAGRRPALRVRTDARTLTVHDRQHGDVAGPVDDFVVRRNDGAHAYNLAVVVDDAEQDVGEVVRGDDLLETTARQVWLQRALDLPTPSYVHVPLMLGEDGARLAKRHSAVTLADQRALGHDPAQVRATLARSVGIVPTSPDPTMDDLLRAFDPPRPALVTVRRFVRYWMPGIVCVAGIVAMVIGPDESRVEGGAAILGAGLAIYLINFLFRVGVSGDRERAEEQKARDFYEEHGFWPDERPPTENPPPS